MSGSASKAFDRERLTRAAFPRSYFSNSVDGPAGHGFAGQPAKCEVAHTSPPIIPYKNPATWNQEGTHGTQTSYRRDCSCNGADHSNGHDGHAAVTDFRSSTFAVVLRRSTSFFRCGCLSHLLIYGGLALRPLVRPSYAPIPEFVSGEETGGAKS